MTTLELPTFTFHSPESECFALLDAIRCAGRVAHKNPSFIMIFIYLPTSRATIYEIYKKNIAQIIIKNVRTTSEGKQKKQEQSKSNRRCHNNGR